MAEDADWQGEGDDYDEDTVVIIDSGSGMCKAGLSCDERPTSVFPEVLGRPRKKWTDSMDKEIYVGDECHEFRNKLAMAYPIESGVIENFTDMELLWEHTFCDRLKVDSTKHPVLLTEPPYNPKPNRESMVEMMFESFGVPSLNVSIQGVLALLGQGRTTGLVLDSGEGVTHTIPIYDGFGMPHCIHRLALAGRDLNTLLAKLLAQPPQDICLTTTVEQYHARIIKEKHCYVALDPSSEFAEQVVYKMPDGKEITLGDERWKCPEALFSPSLVGIEAMGVAGLVWESVSGCDIDLRKTLLSNVVLSGGSTMFPGFAERLGSDLRSSAPAASRQDIRVVHPKDQIYAVWSGAQVFASLRTLQEDQWMTYEDYEEYGVAFIHDKIAVRFN